MTKVKCLNPIAACGLDLLGENYTVTDDADAEEWRQQIATFPQKLGEDAWYPTLDKDACAECGKCLEFCPFGVYEMVDDRITVTFNARN